MAGHWTYPSFATTKKVEQYRSHMGSYIIKYIFIRLRLKDTFLSNINSCSILTGIINVAVIIYMYKI